MEYIKKYTPGPWYSGYDIVGEEDEFNNRIYSKNVDCFYRVAYMDTDNENAKADARLIASAPQLYEALCDIVLKVCTPDFIEKNEELCERIFHVFSKVKLEHNREIDEKLGGIILP